jgi:hypothetical protein
MSMDSDISESASYMLGGRLAQILKYKTESTYVDILLQCGRVTLKQQDRPYHAFVHEPRTFGQLNILW